MGRGGVGGAGGGGVIATQQGCDGSLRNARALAPDWLHAWPSRHARAPAHLMLMVLFWCLVFSRSPNEYPLPGDTTPWCTNWLGPGVMEGGTKEVRPSLPVAPNV